MDEIKELLINLKKRVESLEKNVNFDNLIFTAAGTLVVPVVSSDPVSGVDGQVIFNSTAGKLKVWVASSWVAVH